MNVENWIRQQDPRTWQRRKNRGAKWHFEGPCQISDGRAMCGEDLTGTAYVAVNPAVTYVSHRLACCKLCIAAIEREAK